MFSTTTASMQGFFKNAVSTALYSSSNDDIHAHRSDDVHPLPSASIHKSNNHSHSSLLSTGTKNYFLHSHNDASKSKVRINGLSESDIKAMVNDTEIFHFIQEQLRNRQSQTNALVKQIGIELIREKFIEIQIQKQIQQQKQHMEQKKLQIARELTEARIKARQALKLPESIQKKDSYGDDTENEKENDDYNMEENSTLNNEDEMLPNQNTTNSPTSAMATIDPTVVTKMMMMTTTSSFDSSEDGDIQEVDDEQYVPS